MVSEEATKGGEQAGAFVRINTLTNCGTSVMVETLSGQSRPLTLIRKEAYYA